MTKQFSPQELEQLNAWMVHKIDSMHINQKTVILSGYVKALLKRDVEKTKMIGQLEEFMEGHAVEFVEELHSRLQTKDFSFAKTPEPVVEIEPVHEEPPKEEPVQQTESEPTKKPAYEESKSHRKGRQIHEESKDKFSEPKVESPRHVIFIAGIGPNLNKITRLFKAFSKYGAIVGIETMPEKKVALIEYEQLRSAFHAVVDKSNPLGASCIRIGYAVEPDPERIEEIETVYRTAKEERTKAYMQKKEQERIDEQQAILDGVKEAMAQTQMELDQCTDDDRKQILENEIRELKHMLESLQAGNME